MKPLIIYHANCTDGFAAAYAAWLKFGDEAEYLSMNYGEWSKLFEGYPQGGSKFDGRDVYVLDFNFDEVQTKTLIEFSTYFVWLDHHKTAFENWAGDERQLYLDETEYTYIVLDNSKSGALLAWEYFHREPPPKFIQMVDDRDRWQFKLADSKAFHAGMTMQKPWTFEKWKILLESGERGLGEVISVGHSVLAYQDQQVQSLVKHASQVRVPIKTEQYGCTSESGLAVNTSVHMSEVGHELANASGTFGLIWYLDEGGVAKCSLRSNGDYDVSEVAKHFGGGGHKNAAGFSVPVDTLLGWLK